MRFAVYDDKGDWDMKCAIGLDYGTNSVRCVIVDTANGRELGTCVFEYPTGAAGIILDPADHNLARQNPADYLQGAEVTIAGAIAAARQAEPAFDPRDIVGIGVDTTGSTPLPVDRQGTPLAMLTAFKDNPNAHAWLWKDHTGYAEAGEITALAREHAAAVPGQVRRDVFLRVVLQQDSALPAGGPGGLRRRVYVGRARRLAARPC